MSDVGLLHLTHAAAACGTRCILGALLAATVLLETTAAHGKCSLMLEPDLPVTMQGLVPLVHAAINGKDALFIADSGAFFNVVSSAAVAQYGMRADASRQLDIAGFGGMQRAEVASAKSFTIMGVTLPKVEFVMASTNFGSAAGLLGQNVFRSADVEYDLANGVIRLVRTKDCKDSPLAYWAAATGKPYSVMDIEFATMREPHTRGVAFLNGTKIRVLFDTGTGHSVLTMAAARRAGMTPQSEGVQPGGGIRGVGQGTPDTWIGRFANFKVGDEEIEHARLRFGNVNLLSADMVIGADFFLSHRIYVASSQRKLYFTYNGGPVFDLETVREPSQAAESGAAPENPTAAPDAAGSATPAPQPDVRLNQPTDAAGFARRAAASAARHDYGSAIADLTRACELAPGDPSYPYQRALLYWHNQQLDLARADLDQAIKLKPDDVESLVARAQLEAARHDAAGSARDLETADHAAAKESDVRLRIASLYESLDNPAAAHQQYGIWIDAHPRDDPRLPGALNSRCWEGALAGRGLDQALADCNAALKIYPEAAAFLDSRGLVYLRRGDYDKAIADYDAALRRRPKQAWSLYGRGLARLHKGQTAAGQADLAAATAMQPEIAARAAKFGLTPP